MAAECKVHKLVADVAVVARGRVLLVKYRDVRRYDGQTGWFLPDDFLSHGEHPDRAAERILAEQAGLTGVAARLGYIESLDGDGGPWHLVFHYVAEVGAPGTVASRGNVAAAEWFDLGNLPPKSEMSHHGWAADVLRELRVAAK